MSNLPPGVNERMIPGNRPEDQEVEVELVLTVGDLDALERWGNQTDPACDELLDVLASIVEQLREAGAMRWTCPECYGEGVVQVECRSCGGEGELVDPWRGRVICDECRGTRWSCAPCPKCNGEGRA